MPLEPSVKRVYAFVDCQNLYKKAAEVFGCRYPDFEPFELSRTICSQRQGWELDHLCVYTGIHSPEANRHWYNFWNRKLMRLQTRGATVFSRQLRYINGNAEEKGIDVRIALDIVRFAIDQVYDVALIFSQDQDLHEAVLEVKRIVRIQDRWIKVASAYPFDEQSGRRSRGIGDTEWIRIDRATYDPCIDPFDYRQPLTGEG